MGLARVFTATVLVGALVVPLAQRVDSPVGFAAAAPGGVPADGVSAADGGAAAAVARLYGHAVVVDSSTTETSQVEALPDGTMRLTEIVS